MPKREHCVINSPVPGDWTCIFSAPLYPNGDDSINNVTPATSGVAYINTELAAYLTVQKGKNSFLWDMNGTTYPNLLNNSNYIKVEFSIYPTGYASNGMYFYPAYFGQGTSSSSAWASDTVVLTCYTHTYNTTFGSWGALRTWTKITFEFDRIHNILTTSNDQNTNTTTLNYTLNLDTTNTRYLGSFNKIYSGGGTFRGYIKDLKVYVK